ncbi:hypothetical protein F5878DRAFT_630120 [Lentinula raphanica]|uniref:Uncharacterized protein n=1 Tax=Lentinula raphanica TaxID=153919 RepID=A0AA38P1S4_9AGAR|nr:hypothetical protein F5878DRAFT_630120 [Lentinula raphanica]
MGYMYSPLRIESFFVVFYPLTQVSSSRAGLFASTSSIDTSLYLVSSRLVLLHSNSTIMVKIKTLAPGILVVLASSLLQTSLVTSVLALPVQSDHGQPEKVAVDGKLAAAVTRSAQSTQSTQTTAAAAPLPTGTGSSHPGLSRRCSRSNALKPQTKVKRHKPDSVKNYLQYHGIYKMPFLVDASEDYIEVMIAGIQNSAVFEQVKTGGMSDRVKAMHDKALERIEEWRLQPKCEDDDDDDAFYYEDKDVMDDDIPRLRVCWWWDQLVFRSRCSQASEDELVPRYAPDGSLHEDYLVVQGLHNTHSESLTSIHTDTHTNTHSESHTKTNPHTDSRGVQSTHVGSGHSDSTAKPQVGSEMDMEDMTMDSDIDLDDLDQDHDDDPMSNIVVSSISKKGYKGMIKAIRLAAKNTRGLKEAERKKALERCAEWERDPDDPQEKERVLWWYDVLVHKGHYARKFEYRKHNVRGSLTYWDHQAREGKHKGKGKATR